MKTQRLHLLDQATRQVDADRLQVGMFWNSETPSRSEPSDTLGLVTFICSFGKSERAH